MSLDFQLNRAPRRVTFLSPLFLEFGIPHFHKPSLPITAQVRLLKTRGVDITDEDEAASFLKCVSYYRLRAYWRPFNLSIDNRFRVMPDDSHVPRVYGDEPGRG